MKRCFRRALGLMRQWPLLLGLLVVAIVFQLAYHVGGPLTLKLIFDGGILAQDYTTLITGVAILFATLVSFTVGAVIQEVAMARLGPRAINKLRLAMFCRIPALTGDGEASVADRFGRDIAAFETALVRAVPTALAYGAAAVVCLAMLFAIDWRLATAAVLAMSLIFLAPMPFARRAPGASERYAKASSDVSSYARESAAGRLIVRIFALDKPREAEFSRRLDEAERAGFAAHFNVGMVARTTIVAVGFVQVLVIGLGGYLAYLGEITPGYLVAFVGLLLSIGDSVNHLSNAMPLISAGGGAIGQIDRLIENTGATAQSGGREVPDGARNVAVAGVDFAYDPARPLLKDVSLDIEPGTRAALVGPSGCGKSTLLMMVAGLHVPGRGSISIGGVDMAQIDETCLRRRMAVVPQTSLVFAGTVAENIRLGREEIDRERIEHAAAAAQIDPFIRALPDGYDTVLPSGGGGMSGGQRQRLSIARALAGDPGILLLDEVTSALDPITESAVNKSILDFTRDRTTIAVTHRLATVVDFDRIYVLRDGRVVEHGRHDELVRRGGLYAEMWRTQSGFEVDEAGDATVTPERLREIPFFATCDEQTLADVASAFASEHIVEGQKVIQAGEMGDRFYVVVHGQLDVYRADPGIEEPIHTLSEGEFFGEIALIESRPRTATVVARTDSLCLTLPRQHFLNLLDRDPQMKERVTDAIARRLTVLESGEQANIES